MILGLASVQRYESIQSTLEWFAYYLINGVERFCIYNHNMPNASEDPTVEIWKKLSKHFDIIHKECTGYDFYPRVYQNIMNTFRNETDWMIWSDSDEFYLPIKYRTIKETLSKYNCCSISALGIYWTNFGGNGHIEDPEFVTQGYTKRSFFERSVNHHINSIVKGKHAGKVLVTNPHIYTTEFGTIDLEGRIIEPHCGCNSKDISGCSGIVTHDIMRINHYYSKSWNYFKTRKQVRGPGDRPLEAFGGFISDQWYHDNNFNDVEDTLIWDKFGKEIIEKVDYLKGLL